MPRPTVRMIRHPPTAVPAVSAAAHTNVTHVGAASVLICPAARSSAAITPTAFWASLAPWLNASAAAVAHCPPRTWRPPSGETPDAPTVSGADHTSAPSAPSGGEITSEINVPITPTGCPPFQPPQLTACTPPSARAAPTRPPTSACAELDGSPRLHVARFHLTAAAARRRSPDRPPTAARSRSRRSCSPPRHRGAAGRAD